MAERIVDIDGVTLCTEAFGDPADPPVLLVMGIGASMLWWDARFCQALAAGGRRVIRYDHRDTGRSQTDEPGRPSYGADDLVADAVRVLDAHGVPAAHIVGTSAGGAFAQVLALGTAERVLSLVLISSSPATPGDRELPPPSAEFAEFVATAEVAWNEPGSVIEYLVGYARVLNGARRDFDEPAWRELVRRDVERARDVAALQNHDVLAHDGGTLPPLAAIGVPTLVIHGTADPMFPPRHGEALAEEIPGATLMLLDGAGHGVDARDADTIVAAILAHTRPRRP